MNPEGVEFHSASIEFSPNHENMLRAWIGDAVNRENLTLVSLSFVFCADDYLLSINKNYLDHVDYTDVITFDYTEDDGIVGEIYISIDRVKENAGIFQQPFENELHRVMIHGVLHLCGYADSAADQKQKMTEKEDYYLSLRTF